MTEPAVLIVEDDAHLREALFDTLSADSVPVVTVDSGPKALEVLGKRPIGLVVSDLQMEPMDGATLLENIRVEYPALPAILMTAHGTIENAVDAMRNGACDYLVKPFDARQLKDLVDKHFVAPVESRRPVAVDPKSLALLRVAERVARTEATVTICGESGCGKEVFARFIHDSSPRRGKPFVAINCAAIPEHMLEALLFGHEKGAFTGAASAHAGKFEQANGGTLLLDEVSEMDLALQAKLLRVIQEREVERIGGRKLIALDVRVLATTNRDLKKCVTEGTFREDLYYRLNVFPLHIPALRQRPGDIVPLAEFFLHGSAEGANCKLDAAACERLMAHRWPGNVRELDNLIQRTLILRRGSNIRAGDLAFEDELDHGAGDASSALQPGLKEREFQLILDALEANSGRRAAAAKALDISPRTLRYKLARMRDSGIVIPGDRHE